MINADFEKFIRAAELSSSLRYSPLYFEVPYVDLGFTGATRLANEEKVRILNFAPSRTAIVQLSSAPYIVIPLDDILLVWFDEGECM